MLFTIRNIRASRVNLLMNDYAAGLPSPLSFLGLAESVGRALGVPPWSARIVPILHEVHVSPGRTKPEMEEKSGSFSPIEIIEDMHGTVQVSIIIDLPGVEKAQDVKDVILCKRIAGGVISNRDLRVDVVAPEGGLFKGLSRGYAMLRPDQTERRLISSGNLIQMERIAQLLFPAVKEPGSGWIVPVAVGHRMLESPDTVPKRIRARSPDMPHIFVEPCVGIAELVSIRNTRLTGLNEAGLRDLFWHWSIQGEHILGHSAYSPVKA